MSSDTQTPTPRHLPRRTVAAGAVWAIPAVAIAGAAPAYASSQTTLPPCLSEIVPTGGTYPVTVSLSNCSTENSHWDFIFKIKAGTKNGTDCDCDQLRVTVFDNPKRSRLWISNNSVAENPQSNANNSPRLYVQKTINAGATGTFPAAGDTVRRVASPYTSFTPSTGPGSVVGNITAPGTADDSFHTIFNPGGGALACGASGPIAYYTVECANDDGTFTLLGERGEIDPICVPMIQATVCRASSSSNGTYKLSISVLRACGIPTSDFQIKSVYRNDDTNFPDTGGNLVWSGTQLVGGGTSITTNTSGSTGGQLWITFTTDGGANTSKIRVPITSVSGC